MINYVQLEDFTLVRWNKKLLGRIYKESGQWVYKPRGCGWTIKSEPFTSIERLKNYLEGK